MMEFLNAGVTKTLGSILILVAGVYWIGGTSLVSLQLTQMKRVNACSALFTADAQADCAMRALGQK